MQDDDDMTSDDLNDDFDEGSESSLFNENKKNADKFDSRRKLEEYLENKRLNDEFDYW